MHHMTTDAHNPDTFVPSPQDSPNKSFIAELIKFALIAIVIVIPVRLFIAQPFIVSGASMYPTFEDGEYLIVDELSYRFTEPERGDIIIFRFPRNPSKYFIKRIVGLPNETIRITDSNITVTNDEHPEGFVLAEPYLDVETIGARPITLGSDEYFVLGDNRPASSDSRIWGPLPRDLIIGRALMRLLPIARAAVLPGEEALSNAPNE